MDDSAVPIKKLGRYDITRVLGKGAMGVVYEARDPNLNRKVAIKTVRVDSLTKEEAADYELRFRTEAHSAARLQHPNIVSVYDSDRDGNTPFLVMEYVQGEDLKHYLDSGQRYTLEQSVRMMRDLLAALEYAHQHKIVHRDIKPANLMIEANGRVKLTDFGVARIQDSGEATRTQGGMVGTLKYMSPEQLEGKTVGGKSDLFSAGIVLYQLLTDRRPFDGDSYFSIVNQITNQNPPAPSSINQMLPPALDAVVARALAKDKTQRFATAQDFSTALQAAARRADQTIVPTENPYKTVDPYGTSSLERSGSTVSHTLSSSGSTVTQELELVYWKDVKESDDPHDLEGFIKRFPGGVYADLAKRRLKRIVDSMAARGDGLYERTFSEPGPESTAPPSAPAPQSHSTSTSVSAILPSPNLRLDDDPTLPGLLDSQPAALVPAALVPAAFEPIPDSLDYSPEATLVQKFNQTDLLKSETTALGTDAESTVLIAPSAKKSSEKKSLENMSFKAALQGNAPKAVEPVLPHTRAPALEEKPASAVRDATQSATASVASAAIEPAPRRQTGLLVGVAAAVVAAVAAFAWLGSGPKTDSSAMPANAPALSASAALPNTSPSAADASNPTAAPGASPAADAVLSATSIASQSPAFPASATASVEEAAKAKAKAAASGASAPSASASVAAAAASAASAARASRAQALRDAASARSSISGTYTTSTPTAVAPLSSSQSANDAVQQNASAAKPAAAERPKDGAPSSPNDACKDRVLFGYASCIGEQCAKSVFSKHPICVERREQDERRKAAEQLR